MVAVASVVAVSLPVEALAVQGMVSCGVSVAGARPRLADIDGKTRLAWIDARLSDAGRRARSWTLGWGWGIGASGLASLAVVPLVRSADRVDWYTSAGSAAIGVVPFLLSPLDVARDAPILHGRIEDLAARSAQDDVCALLAEAESTLLHDAENEERQRRWYFHAGNLAFNMSVALFLGLGFHHWTAGLINGMAGAAVGEVIILSQPTRSIESLRGYRAAAIGAGDSTKF